MKRHAVAIVGLCLLASGCNQPDSTSAATDNDANGVGATQEDAALAEGHVAGFTLAGLEGLVVRDHPEGAEVVTPPVSQRESTVDSTGLQRGTPSPNRPPCLCSRGAVLTHVNDAPVRNAAHFRELMNAAAATGEEIRIGQRMFLLDRGNGMVAVSSSPPEEQ